LIKAHGNHDGLGEMSSNLSWVLAHHESLASTSKVAFTALNDPMLYKGCLTSYFSKLIGPK